MSRMPRSIPDEANTRKGFPTCVSCSTVKCRTCGKEILSQMTMIDRFDQKTRRIWAILCLAVKKFLQIDGGQWAGAFAFNAFFSLFPLIVLFVTITSAFIDLDRAGKEIIAYMERYVPIRGEMQSYIFDTIAGVVKARGQVGAVAFLILVWVANHPHLRDQPRLGYHSVQLVVAAAEKPGVARHHSGCGPHGHDGAGAGENGEGLALSSG